MGIPGRAPTSAITSSASGGAGSGATNGAERPGERHRFDVVMRGYERSSVDEHFARAVEESAALRRELADSERRRQAAEQHATATEQEIRGLRSEQQYSSPSPEGSFGMRAEKLLRLAEREAAEMRATAAQETSSLIEKARAEAEQHRHEVEQNLITRAAELDQQAAVRTVEQQEREQRIAEQVAAARSETEGLHDAARRAAEQLSTQAEAEADAVRARAAQDAHRVQEQAGQEVRRLGELRERTRAELGRLAELLNTELAGDDTPKNTPRRTMGDRRSRMVGPESEPADAKLSAAQPPVVR